MNQTDVVLELHIVLTLKVLEDLQLGEVLSGDLISTTVSTAIGKVCVDVLAINDGWSGVEVQEIDSSGTLVTTPLLGGETDLSNSSQISTVMVDAVCLELRV